MKIPQSKCPVGKWLLFAFLGLFILFSIPFVAGKIFLNHPQTAGLWDRKFMPQAQFFQLEPEQQAAIYESTYSNATLMADLAKQFFSAAIDLSLALAVAMLVFLFILRKYRRKWLQREAHIQELLAAKQPAPHIDSVASEQQQPKQH